MFRGIYRSPDNIRATMGLNAECMGYPYPSWSALCLTDFNHLFCYF